MTISTALGQAIGQIVGAVLFAIVYRWHAKRRRRNWREEQAIHDAAVRAQHYAKIREAKLPGQLELGFPTDEAVRLKSDIIASLGGGATVPLDSDLHAFLSTTPLFSRWWSGSPYFVTGCLPQHVEPNFMTLRLQGAE